MMKLSGFCWLIAPLIPTNSKAPFDTSSLKSIQDHQNTKGPLVLVRLRFFKINPKLELIDNFDTSSTIFLAESPHTNRKQRIGNKIEASARLPQDVENNISHKLIDRNDRADALANEEPSLTYTSAKSIATNKH